MAAQYRAIPHLDIFSQGLLERPNGGWRITEKGWAGLELTEARPAELRPASPQPDLSPATVAPLLSARGPAEANGCRAAGLRATEHEPRRADFRRLTFGIAETNAPMEHTSSRLRALVGSAIE